MTTKVAMLTTVDNPFDPFTQFDEWYAFDEGKGYGTCGYLARVTITSPELSEADNVLAVREAMNEIVSLHGSELYKIVEEEDSVDS